MARKKGAEQVGSQPPDYREWRRAASVEDIGRRPELEDAHFFFDDFRGEDGEALGGVFDGHYDGLISRMAAEEAPSLVDSRLAKGEPTESALVGALKDVDEMGKGQIAGSTAVVFLVSKGEVVCANLGDSVLIMVNEKGHEVLTEEHRLSNPSEKARIKSLGTEIDGKYVMLPDGNGVMCTRALGDHRFRQAGVIAEPFVARAPLHEDVLWLVAACDGLTDELTPAEIARRVRACATPREACEDLRDMALVVRGGTDNLTILVVELRAQGRKQV